MNFFDKYFFGYLPQNLKNIIRGICLIVLAILLLELALTFIIVVVLIGIISKILMRFFN
jgi:ABC-type transport system involved in cytochrome bd biosynthesis fused ATPase/permease subunit